MPRKRQRQLFSGNSDTVIANSNQTSPAGLNFDVDTSGARIEAVLDELLQRRCGPFYHFACRDLIDELRGKKADRHATYCKRNKRD